MVGGVSLANRRSPESSAHADIVSVTTANKEKSRQRRQEPDRSTEGKMQLALGKCLRIIAVTWDRIEKAARKLASSTSSLSVPRGRSLHYSLTRHDVGVKPSRTVAQSTSAGLC